MHAWLFHLLADFDRLSDHLVAIRRMTNIIDDFKGFLSYSLAEVNGCVDFEHFLDLLSETDYL